MKTIKTHYGKNGSFTLEKDNNKYTVRYGGNYMVKKWYYNKKREALKHYEKLVTCSKAVSE